jgi:hypothetical protein
MKYMWVDSMHRQIQKIIVDIFKIIIIALHKCGDTFSMNQNNNLNV